jgi:hemerythrin-like domain-containing protein
MAATHTSTRRSEGKSARRSNVKSNAITLLKSDHAEVADLLDRYEKRKSKLQSAQKQELAREICSKLAVHAQIEEEIFYPAVAEQVDDAEDLVGEARVEHASLKHLIGQIEGGSPDSAEYDAQVKVLGEYVKHHVKEEQNELFPMVRKSDIDLATLGEQLATRKQELMQERR